MHITTVRPSPVISRMRSSTACDDSGSRPDVGSSNSSRSGSCSTDRAQRETGLHPGRVAADLLVERLGDAEPLGRRGCDRSPSPPRAVELGGVGEVVAARQPVVERGLGRHDAAPAAHRFAVDARGRARTRAPSRSCGLERARDHADGGRLARAVRPEQHGDRSCRRRRSRGRPARACRRSCAARGRGAPRCRADPKREGRPSPARWSRGPSSLIGTTPTRVQGRLGLWSRSRCQDSTFGSSH